MNNNNQNFNIPTKEIGELLEIVSEKAPKLVSDLLSTVYSEDAGSRIGKAVGNFYKQLVDSGIPNNEALEMTKDYMNQVKSVASGMVPKNIVNHNSANGRHSDHYRESKE